MTDKAALRECPFCGGEASIYEEIPGGYIVQCHDCCGQIGIMTKEHVIRAWNARAERTCQLTENGSLANWPEMVCWSCSECGFGWHHSRNDKQFTYCPNCGARVVE